MMDVIVVSPTQLQNMIKSAVSDAIEGLNIKSGSSNVYLNADQLCEYLGIAKSTLSIWKRKNKVPYSKLGKRVVFDKKLIDELVQKNVIRAENV